MRRKIKIDFIFCAAVMGLVILTSGCDWKFGFGKKNTEENALSADDQVKINDVVTTARKKKLDDTNLVAEMKDFLDNSKVRCSSLISRSGCEELAKTVVQNKKISLALKKIAGSGVEIIIGDHYTHEKNIYMDEAGAVRIDYRTQLYDIKKFLKLEE